MREPSSRVPLCRHVQVGFPQFARVVCEVREALRAAAVGETPAAPPGGASAGVSVDNGRALLESAAVPLLAMKGTMSRTNLSDESFVNPLRHLQAGRGIGYDPLAGRRGLCGSETWMEDLEAWTHSARERAERVGSALRTEVGQHVVEPLLELGALTPTTNPRHKPPPRTPTTTPHH